jgi:hypothetical protein
MAAHCVRQQTRAHAHLHTYTRMHMHLHIKKAVKRQVSLRHVERTQDGYLPYAMGSLGVVAALVALSGLLGAYFLSPVSLRLRLLVLVHGRAPCVPMPELAREYARVLHTTDIATLAHPIASADSDDTCC